MKALTPFLLVYFATACSTKKVSVGTVETVWPRAAVRLNLNAPFVGLAPGTIGHAQVQVRDSNGYPVDAPVRWRSSNPKVVEVRQVRDDVVDLLYHRTGRAVLSASAAGATESVVLYAGPIPRMGSIRIRPDRATAWLGDLIRLKAFAYDAHHQSQSALWVRWTWSDSTRVRFFGVPAWGEVILEALKPGCVTIIASHDSAVATSQLAIGPRGSCAFKR